MKKASPKKVKKQVMPDIHTNDDVKRYIGAVAEHFEQQVSAVAEQFLGLNEKLDAQGAILNEHTTILNEHTALLNEHTTRLNEHTQMIGRILVDVEDIKINMKEKVSRDEFSKLEKRLVSLESFVFTRSAKTAPRTNGHKK